MHRRIEGRVAQQHLGIEHAASTATAAPPHETIHAQAGRIDQILLHAQVFNLGQQRFNGLEVVFLHGEGFTQLDVGGGLLFGHVLTHLRSAGLHPFLHGLPDLLFTFWRVEIHAFEFRIVSDEALNHAIAIILLVVCRRRGWRAIAAIAAIGQRSVTAKQGLEGKRSESEDEKKTRHGISFEKVRVSEGERG